MMNLLPQPKVSVWNEENFCLNYQARIVLETEDQSSFLYAKMLQSEVKKATGMKLAVLRGKARTYDICLCTQQGCMGKDASSLKREQGYQLMVTEEQVIVRAETKEAGEENEKRKAVLI